MKKIIFCTGLLAILFGGLWLLQGLGLVQLRPILCFAQCDPIQAPSSTWAVVGGVVLLAGSAAVFLSLKRRPR